MREMSRLHPIRQAYERYGIAHTVGRGLEFLSLQTRPTAWLYYRLAPVYYRRKYSRDLTAHTHPPDPFETRWIDPQCVTRFSFRKTPSAGALYGIGRVLDGDWDQRRTPSFESRTNDLIYGPSIEETLLYRALANHFNDGVPWEETEFIQQVHAIIKSGEGVWHDCRSIQEVQQRCDELDVLYGDIRESGYRTQRELRELAPSLDEPFGFMNEQIMEVSVDIARDGELLLVDGRHRVILAQLLELEEIPVTIVTRHKQWMTFREEQLQSGNLIDHPDFPNQID